MSAPSRTLRAVFPLLLAAALFPLPARADEVHFKNGLVLRGSVVSIGGLNARTRKINEQGNTAVTHLLMLDDGVRRYFFARKAAEQIIPDDQLARLVTFDLEHKRTGRGLVPAIIGRYVNKGEFDAWGRRVVTLKTQRGDEPIHQAITQVRPDYFKVESTSHDWELGYDLSVVPSDTLREMVQQSIDAKNPDDRMAVVVFFMQAEMYKEAREELEAIERQFPERAPRAEEIRREVAHVNALRGLNEVRRRQKAGQHGLAYNVASKFPADRVSADVLREARDIVTAYDHARQQAEKVRMLLGTLQAELPDDVIAQLAPLRGALLDELNYETLPRLEPFLRSEADATLPAEQKLALAYSGWVLGSSAAIIDLPEAIRMWQARHLVLEYLRCNDNPLRRAAIVEELQATEGASVQRLTDMVPQLPLPIEMPAVEPGTVVPVEVKDEWNRTQERYSVVLPPEYSPHHRYPLLVVLRSESQTTEQELLWWAGNVEQPGYAQRRGYVVIAPEYAAEDQTSYDYTAAPHSAVLASINDARKRFRIDSGRIYLAGHGMGGDACFDIGMSHPDVFAGVVPILGMSDRFCRWYRLNGPQLPWYIIGGERDRDSITRNAVDLNEMMKKGHDIIYCEYKARGYEGYHEEQSRLFDWMEFHRRPANPRDWEVKILRDTDNRFYGLESSALPDKLAQPISWEEGRPRAAFTVSSRVTPTTNTIFVTHPGRQGTLWLSPELINFDEKLIVKANGRSEHADYLKPDAGALLEALRLTGDRERLYWGRIEL
jgi:hypothetical protein